MASTRQHRKPQWGLGEYAPSNEGRQEITELVLQAGLPLLFTILPLPAPYRAGPRAGVCAKQAIRWVLALGRDNHKGESEGEGDMHASSPWPARLI